MSPEAQRIAIAEACGWRLIQKPSFENGMEEMRFIGSLSFRREFWEVAQLRDYLNDLNAMHEAEKLLSEDRLWYMSARLAEIVPAETPIAHASASERAQAFLESYDKFLGEDDE